MNEQRVELDGRSLQNPVYYYHRRARNWGAVITGKNAANCQRAFLRAAGPIVDLSSVESGDVLEFGGDHVSGSGRRRPDRCWWHVLHIDDDTLVFNEHESLSKAIRAARLAGKPENDVGGGQTLVSDRGREITA